MDTLSIYLESIKLDEAAQPRVELDDEYIEELANDLMAGSKFPPVVVFRYGEDYHLADGFHRYRAHQKAGLDKIVAEIRRGDRREAIMHAVGANATHGKRRSNADKRKAIETLLKDEIWGAWTDRAIAKRCRVSQPFVGTIRKELTDNGFQFPKKRFALDGRQIDTTKIGSTRATQNAQGSENPVAQALEVGLQESTATDTAAPTTGIPDVNHQVEKTHPVVNQREVDDDAEASETAPFKQSNSPDSPEPEGGNQPEDDASSIESQVEETLEETEAIANDQSLLGTAATTPDDEGTNGPQASIFDSEDLDPMSQKVRDLEQALAEAKNTIAMKNERINELEDKIRELEQDNEYYRRELMMDNDGIEETVLPFVDDVPSQAAEAQLA